MKMPTEIIREEIGKNRVITFARFMELALYCPETGYYETNQDNVGRVGDFITSVSTGELFGQLLAFQFAQWLGEFKIQNSKFKIVEAGAHDGKLAADILNWLKLQRPELFARIEYIILEPSVPRQAWQNEMLKLFAPHVRWSSGWSEMAGRDAVEPKPKNVHGIIFSNELLDAMPVHRYGWDARSKTWFEWGVTIAGEKFIWTKITHHASRITHHVTDLPAELLAVLPDGYTIETSFAAENWWREAAEILAHGKLLAIDYGHTADEIFSPGRTRGTLRAYFRHHVSDDLLASPGEQDLTAHVNFSAIQKAGEDAGLKTENFCTQPQFLTQILGNAMKDKSFGGWNARRTRQFQTLTHPEHLGRAFRVLVQSR
jgi:SAM-dependent MidA family methyltransferase